MRKYVSITLTYIGNMNISNCTKVIMWKLVYTVADFLSLYTVLLFCAKNVATLYKNKRPKFEWLNYLLKILLALFLTIKEISDRLRILSKQIRMQLWTRLPISWAISRLNDKTDMEYISVKTFYTRVIRIIPRYPIMHSKYTHTWYTNEYKCWFVQ